MKTEEERAREKRASRIISAGVIGMFALIGLSIYLWEDYTHGPFSADRYVPQEMEKARAIARDGVLTYLGASYVNEKGQIQAAFSDRKYWQRAGHLIAEFRADHVVAPKPPKPVLPVGAPAFNEPEETVFKSKCTTLRLSTGLHGVMRQTSFGIEPSWIEPKTCDAPIPLPVHCKFTEIWKRAMAAGAPHPAFADISLWSGPITGIWHFKIVNHEDHDKVIFRAEYPDDCK